MKITFIPVLFALFISSGIQSQVNCSQVDLNNHPGQWVWAKAGYGSQWQYCDPIRKELQRIIPTALPGLHATNSIAFGQDRTFFFSPSPKFYECYLMLRKYECLKSYNKIQPEGETGCWAYFVMNSIESVNASLPGFENLLTADNSFFKTHTANFWFETDAAGNRILYSSTSPGKKNVEGYFFSGRPGMPIRKLSKKELYQAYKIHHDKRLNEQIVKFEKLVASDEKSYNAQKASGKNDGTNWADILRQDQDYLDKYAAEKKNLNNWYSRVMGQPGLDQPAMIQRIDINFFKPELLEAASDGLPVWVDNPAFFDMKKPVDEPQSIFLWARRQDSDVPKKKFMDIFYGQFNLDVLCRMTGEAPKKPNGINTLSGSETGLKLTTQTEQQQTGAQHFGFENSTAGQFPKGWRGMTNANVQSVENKNQLTISQNGYWYPRQFNKEIKDGFSLAFDLSWPKDITYYSGLFTLTLSEIPYDNAAETYDTETNQRRYGTFYDTYTGNFNRIVCWFDPNWNNAGTLTVYSYDKNENLVINKRISLPGFFKEKNAHHVEMNRRGNALVVIIDGKKEAEIESVFQPQAKYNLYTFSRYKGSDDKTDLFFLGGIDVKY